MSDIDSEHYATLSAMASPIGKLAGKRIKTFNISKIFTFVTPISAQVDLVRQLKLREQEKKKFRQEWQGNFVGESC
jgi:acid phosphatase family membrane protein YuiD